MQRDDEGRSPFDLDDWGLTSLEIPRLIDAQESFVCINDQRTDYGTQSVFVRRVAEMFVNGAVDPLFYVNGWYTSIGPDIGC